MGKKETVVTGSPGLILKTPFSFNVMVEEMRAGRVPGGENTLANIINAQKVEKAIGGLQGTAIKRAILDGGDVHVGHDEVSGQMALKVGRERYLFDPGQADNWEGVTFTKDTSTSSPYSSPGGMNEEEQLEKFGYGSAY